MRFAWLLLLLASHVVAAGSDRMTEELRPAQQALAAGNYPKAHSLYARFSARNPLAQFTLGLFERNGWGRPTNPVAACGWFEKAAHGNIPAAQQFFGDCLAGGIGRNADGKAAIEWYLQAASRSIPSALCSAGTLYIEGKVVAKDVARGLELCEQAARAGSSPSMLRIADYYREGTALPQDFAAARNWYSMAAERHEVAAQYWLGVLLAEGLGGEPDPVTALFWLESAASQGFVQAYLPVAILYSNAEVDPATGALRPEHLGKIYLWNSAAKARTTDAAQLEQIARIEELVELLMPHTWKPDLDKLITEHLAKYPATPNTTNPPAGALALPQSQHSH